MYLLSTNLLSKKELKQAFRKSIFDAFNNECAYCGQEPTSLDHVHPRYLGGQSVASNLVPACYGCNQSKGSKHWLTWYAGTRHYDELKVIRIQDWTKG